MSTNKEVMAFIPARSGSRGVPDKNVRLLAGYPVIAWSIAAAKISETVDRIIVSTDSPVYASIAREYGAETPFLRPAQFATDASPDRDCILHAHEWLKENEDYEAEYWVHLRPTTPLRDPKIVDDAVRAIIDRPQATSLRSGHSAPETPFKWFQLDDNGYFQGLRPDDPRPEYYNLPRQAFPEVYIPDGYVDVLRASFFTSSESLHGGTMMGYVSPSCLEIDTVEELEMIEFQVEKHGSPVLDYLKQYYPR